MHRLASPALLCRRVVDEMPDFAQHARRLITTAHASRIRRRIDCQAAVKRSCHAQGRSRFLFFLGAAEASSHRAKSMTASMLMPISPAVLTNGAGQRQPPPD